MRFEDEFGLCVDPCEHPSIEGDICAVCNEQVPDEAAFITPIGTGMTRVPDDERTEFDAATKSDLNRRLDEFERVRNQGAVDARRHPLH